MRFRQAVTFILFVVLSITLVYNFVLPTLFPKYYGPMGMGMGMGMGMHGRMMSGSYYSNTQWLLPFILVILIIAVVLYYFSLQDKVNRCKQCGFQIENERWKICPICGRKI